MEPIKLDGYSVHFHEDGTQIISPDGDGLMVPDFLMKAIIEKFKEKEGQQT